MNAALLATYAFLKSLDVEGPLIDLHATKLGTLATKAKRHREGRRRGPSPLVLEKRAGLSTVTISRDPKLVPTLCSRLERLPLNDSSIGVALLGAELWLSKEIHQSLEELRRVLRREGLLLVLLKSGSEPRPPEEQGSWWSPSLESVAALLRHHFPHVRSLDLVQLTGCAIYAPNSKVQAKSEQLYISRAQAESSSRHQLLVATKVRRPLAIAVSVIAPEGLVSHQPSQGDPLAAFRLERPTEVHRSDETVGPFCSPGELSPLLIADERAGKALEEAHRALAQTERNAAAERTARVVAERALIAQATKLDDLEEQLRQKTAEARAVVDARARLEPLVERDRARANRAEAEQQRLGQALARSSSRIERLETTVESLDRKLEEAELIVSRHHETQRQLEGRLTEALEERRHFESLAIDLSQELSLSRNESAGTADRLAISQKRMDDLIEETASLRIALESAQRALEELHSELARQTRRADDAVERYLLALSPSANPGDGRERPR